MVLGGLPPMEAPISVLTLVEKNYQLYAGHGKKSLGGGGNIPSRAANVDEQAGVLPSQYSRKCRLSSFGDSVCHGPSILTRLTGLAVRLAGITSATETTTPTDRQRRI